jgi:hypothetical protein
MRIDIKLRLSARVAANRLVIELALLEALLGLTTESL